MVEAVLVISGMFCIFDKENRLLCVLVRIRTVCRSEKTEDNSGLNMIEIHLSLMWTKSGVGQSGIGLATP